MINKIKPKSGWKMLYANIIKCWNSGYGAIFGRFYGIINLALLASTYLLVKNFDVSFTQSIIIGIIMVGVLIFSGWAYLKYGFQKAEYSSNFIEQPELYEMYLRLQRIEEMLNKMQPKKETAESKEFNQFFQ